MGSSIEPVSWVVGVPTVYLNGVAQPDASWALVQPNVLVFSSPPGAGVAITADVSYGLEVDRQQVMIAAWPGATINGAVAAGDPRRGVRRRVVPARPGVP
jgi:hypothetical protein